MKFNEIKLFPELAYTIGLIGGDGTIECRNGGYRISVTDECFEFHQTVIKPLFEKLFSKKAVISKVSGKNSFRTRVASKEVVEVYKRFGVPLNEKTFCMKTPKTVFNSKENSIEYLKGWMDAEGWVTLKTVKRKAKTYTYPKIAFHVANKNIRNDLVKILKLVGITPSIWKYKNMFGFQIIGFDKVKFYLDVAGFRNPAKLLKAQNLPAWGKTRPTMVGTMRCNAERRS